MFVFDERADAPRASRTAEFMALFRALETTRRGPRLFEDPFASSFLERPMRVAWWLSRSPVVGSFVPRLIDAWSPGARTSGIARTRLIDDLLLEALADGCRQIVLLGAGFDARAHRLTGIERAHVFEVDHAGTQEAKKHRLARLLRRPSDHLTYVAVNFERDRLDDAVRAAGFRTDHAAFFVWEGVTNYLSAAAVDETLRAVSSLSAPGSRLLFTYVHRGVLDGAPEFGSPRRLAALLRRLGEPWTFGLDPRRVEVFLRERGYRLSGDWGAADYRARYWGEEGLGMRGYEFYRAALAEVGATCRR